MRDAGAEEPLPVSHRELTCPSHMQLLGPWGGPGNPFLTTEDSRMSYGRGLVFATYRQYNVAVRTGGIHGQACLALCIPSEGLALWLTSNDGTVGSAFNEFICHLVLDELLGLPPQPSLDQRLRQKTCASRRLSRALFEGWEVVPFPPAGSAILGTYADPGHGRLEISSWEVETPTIRRALFTTILGNGARISTSRPIYLFRHPRPYYMTHLVLQANDEGGHTWYACHVASSVPLSVHGGLNGGSVTAQLLGTGPCALVSTGSSQGLGMFGGWWDSFGKAPPHTLPPDEASAAEWAEAWFERL